jgi:hypothetical protein
MLQVFHCGISGSWQDIFGVSFSKLGFSSRKDAKRHKKLKSAPSHMGKSTKCIKGTAPGRTRTQTVAKPKEIIAHNPQDSSPKEARTKRASTNCAKACFHTYVLALDILVFNKVR